MSSSKRLAVLAISNLMILAACGGGSMTPPPPAPIFSTSPSTVAAENAAYTYSPKASDPAGGSTYSYASERTGWCGLERGNGIVDSNASAVARGEPIHSGRPHPAKAARRAQSWTAHSERHRERQLDRHLLDGRRARRRVRSTGPSLASPL